MYEFKISSTDYHIIVDYFLTSRSFGDAKYFWEISVPDNEIIPFLNNLRKYDYAGLRFAFANIKRYQGHQLLYGFSNFQVEGTDNTILFDFKFENDDILRMKFADWAIESYAFIIDHETKAYLDLSKDLLELKEKEKKNEKGKEIKTNIKKFKNPNWIN